MSGNRCQHCGLRNWTYATECDGCGHTLPKIDTRDEFVRVPDKECREEYRSREVNFPQCLSAFWFACAGSIPGLLIWWLFVKEGEQLGFVAFWLITVPAGLAALYGAILGPRIIDPTEVMTSSGAFWRGGLIAFLSFVSLMLILAFAFASVNSGKFLTMLFFLSIYGSILAGWEAVLIGGLAGWLFYKRHR